MLSLDLDKIVYSAKWKLKRQLKKKHMQAYSGFNCACIFTVVSSSRMKC